MPVYNKLRDWLGSGNSSESASILMADFTNLLFPELLIIPTIPFGMVSTGQAR